MPVLLLEAQHAAWIDEAAPAVAHGGESTVNIKAVAASQRYGLFKFDTTLIPAGVTIIDAVVRFYFTGVGPEDAHLSVHKVTGAWNEGVTWATIPAYDAAPKLSVAADKLPVANTWEDFTSIYENYDAKDGIGSPRWWMQRQCKRWYDLTDANHGVLLKADTGVGAAEWVAVGRTGTSHIVPVLEITYATADTLPASAGGDRRAFVGEALAELNASVIKDLDFSVVLELADGDLDVTDDFIAGPTLRRKLPFIGEDLDLGNFNFQLSNKEGKYSPTNRDSKLWLHRAAGRTVVVKATVKGQTVTIYEGVITETPQHGDKRVEVLTTPKLRRDLDYPLATAIDDYTADPYFSSTITGQNPADLFYTLLHNYVGYSDSGADNAFNMASFVAAKAEWTAQGLKVHATWRGDSAWDEINDLQRSTLGSLYLDFQGRFALHVWKPTEPTAVALEGVKNFQWGEDLCQIKNHVTVNNTAYPPENEGMLSYLISKVVEKSVSIGDPQSIANTRWGLRPLKIDQSYTRTPESMSLLTRLYVQALSDPIYRGEADGGIGWMQHDLGDGVSLVGDDESIDETCLVTQQDIDIMARSVELRLIRSNWCLPRRDWVNKLSWYSGAITETFTAGLADPVPSSITGPTLMSSGLMDVVVGWTYEDAELPHNGFVLLVNVGAADPGVPTIQSHSYYFFAPRDARSYRIPNLQADLHLSFAIAAMRGTPDNPYFKNFVTSAAAPDWQDVTLDGAILTGSVPTNVPDTLAGSATQEEDGSSYYSLTWAYTQGAIEADGFYLLGNFSDGAPVGLPTLASFDLGVHLGPDARAFKPLGAKATKYGSFVIAAFKDTIAGPAYTALQSHANWTDLRSASTIGIKTDIIEMVSAPAVTLDEFIASIIIFKDQYWNAGGAASATTPPERTFQKVNAGVEVYYYIKSTFRKRAGFNLLRLTAYMKMLTTWAPTNIQTETVIRVMNYDGTVQQDRIDTSFTDAAYTRNSHDLDISALTNDEIYQVWIGYQISHQAGGAGQTDIWIWAPVVEVRPD